MTWKIAFDEFPTMFLRSAIGNIALAGLKEGLGQESEFVLSSMRVMKGDARV